METNNNKLTKLFNIHDIIFCILVFGALSGIYSILADVEIPNVPMYWKIASGMGAAAATMLAIAMVVLGLMDGIRIVLTLLNEKSE